MKQKRNKSLIHTFVSDLPPTPHLEWMCEEDYLCTIGKPSFRTLSNLNKHSYLLIPNKWTLCRLTSTEPHLLTATHIHQANDNRRRALMRVVLQNVLLNLLSGAEFITRLIFDLHALCVPCDYIYDKYNALLLATHIFSLLPSPYDDLQACLGNIKWAMLI